MISADTLIRNVEYIMSTTGIANSNPDYATMTVARYIAAVEDGLIEETYSLPYSLLRAYVECYIALNRRRTDLALQFKARPETERIYLRALAA